VFPVFLYFNLNFLYETASTSLALYQGPMDMDKYIPLEKDFNEPNDVVPPVSVPTPLNLSLITLDRPLPWYLVFVDWVQNLVNNFVRFWTFKPRN
jgi:hypothetical protein